MRGLQTQKTAGQPDEPCFPPYIFLIFSLLPFHPFPLKPYNQRRFELYPTLYIFSTRRHAVLPFVTRPSPTNITQVLGEILPRNPAKSSDQKLCRHFAPTDDAEQAAQPSPASSTNGAPAVSLCPGHSPTTPLPLHPHLPSPPSPPHPIPRRSRWPSSTELHANGERL